MSFVAETTDSVPWLSETELSGWRALVKATYALMATLDQELQREHRLSLAEYDVMVLLSELGDMRMSDMAGLLHLSPSGMTRRIDGMVRRGFVDRRQCAEDRRGSFATLTEAGWERLREAAPTHVRGVRTHLIDRLSARQLANLTSALEVVDVDESAAAGGCDER
jgi:DNA-binding MarR family transcriptional regulator